jgi:mRNA interferase MazF
VKRGEIWTIVGGPDYAGKPRPAIIVQRNEFDATKSVTICPLSGMVVETVFARFTIQPSRSNGLTIQSSVLVDKVSTIPRSKIGQLVGRLDAKDLTLLNQRLTLFLGLAE